MVAEVLTSDVCGSVAAGCDRCVWPLNAKSLEDRVRLVESAQRFTESEEHRTACDPTGTSTPHPAL